MMSHYIHVLSTAKEKDYTIHEHQGAEILETSLEFCPLQ